METKQVQRKDKQLTPMEWLKSQPKAMQVGPQYHLRKNFGQNKVVHLNLKGGLGSLNDDRG